MQSKDKQESSARTREAMALRRGGRNARRASLLQAAGTMARGISDAQKTSIPTDRRNLNGCH